MLSHLEGFKRELARGVVLAVVLAVTVPASLALADSEPLAALALALAALLVYDIAEGALGLTPPEPDTAELEEELERESAARAAAEQEVRVLRRALARERGER